MNRVPYHFNTIILAFLFFSNCNLKDRTPIKESKKVTMTNTDVIRFYRLQKKLELPENDLDTTHLYKYSDTDFLVAAPILYRQLKDSAYRDIKDSEFNNKVHNIFIEGEMKASP